MTLKYKFMTTLAIVLSLTNFAFAQDISVSERFEKLESAAATPQSNADNAWMLICAALVLLMTVPGLALFYSGLVRKKTSSRQFSKV